MEFAVNNPKCIAWYIAPTYRQAKLIMWQMLLDLIPEQAIHKRNETELIIWLRNGSTISLKGADNPDSLRGVRIDFCVFDEAAFIEKWEEVWTVMRPTLADSKAEVWFISTPNGFNHFKDMSERNDQDWVYFHYTTYDNPHITPSEIEAMRDEMDSDSFAQEILGKFVKRVGVVYDWDSERLYKPFDYDPNLPLHLTWDFGVNDPTAIVFIQPHGNFYRIIDYIERSDGNIESFVAEINAKGYKIPSFETGDIAGLARELTTGKSPIEQLRRHNHFIKTEKIPDIPSQVRNMHRFVQNIYISSSVRSCERVRECFLNYRYPVKRDNLVNQSNEIPIHDQYSHCMRALEYYFWNYKQPRREAAPAPQKKWTIA